MLIQEFSNVVYLAVYDQPTAVLCCVFLAFFQRDCFCGGTHLMVHVALVDGLMIYGAQIRGV